MIGFIDWNVNPQIVDFGFFEIRYYSLLFGLGFISGYFILSGIFKRENLSQELLDKFTVYVILGTILGARIGHCLFYEPDLYLSNPLKIFLPFEGKPGENFRFTGYQGLASHGGAIGLLISIWLFCKKTGQSYLWILDRFAIVTALAAAFIRTGNLFNSEIYGVQTDLPWGFRFLREEIYYGTPPELIVPKHPTQLYEAFAYLFVFVLLYILYKRETNKNKSGFLLGLFLLIVFFARFIIEFVKETQETWEEGMFLNMGQLLSLPFIIAGLVLVFKKAKTKKLA